MGDFCSISGALELSNEQVHELRKLLAQNLDNNPYMESWLIHENGGWACYAFFGHTVKVASLQAVRSQFERIARIRTQDPDVDWPDFIKGRFCVSAADSDLTACEWVLSEGVFHEHRHA